MASVKSRFDCTMTPTQAWIRRTERDLDNGRVLVFGNAHGYHQRHHLGVFDAVEFVSYEATQEIHVDTLKDIQGNTGTHLSNNSNVY